MKSGVAYGKGENQYEVRTVVC